MKFYVEFLANSIKKVITYRFNGILKMVNRLIFMLVQIEIWKIVYGNDFNHIISTDYGMISLNEMIGYTIISHVMYTIIQSTSITSINKRINSGDIAFYIVKPYNFKIYSFVETLGESFVAIIFQAIPLLIFGLIFYRINIPSLSTLLLFIFSLTNGYIIYFMFSFMCGIASFWVIQTGPLEMILSGLIKIFSGVWIPIWFFTGLFSKIVDLLPFKTIYFIPLSIFVGKVTNGEIIKSFIVQIAWIVILYLLVDLVWRLGQKRLMVQGG